MGAILLLLLGTKYNSKIAAVKGYSEVYEEYSALLFYIGATFLIYTLILIYFKYRKSKINR